MTPDDPPGFVVTTELDQAAFRNGFRLKASPAGSWLAYCSTTVPGTLWLAGRRPAGPWWLATDHAGVAEGLGLPTALLPGPGLVRAAVDTLSGLYTALDRLYDLAASTPDDPVAAFHAATAHLPQTTEAERQVVVRVGQGIFRGRLLTDWKGRCPLTGIAEAPLLRASHIVPWTACCSDAERLDVGDGILLSAL